MSRCARADGGSCRASPTDVLDHFSTLFHGGDYPQTADCTTLGLTVGPHPMCLIRELLPDAWTAGELKHGKPGARVQIAGAVSCRQRPCTPKGLVFITLEDETGHANAIVGPQLFEASRLVMNVEPALVITGRLQNESGVIHVLAETIVAMPSLTLPAQASHDFH